MTDVQEMFSLTLGLFCREVRNLSLVLEVAGVSKDNNGSDTLTDGLAELFDGAGGDGGALTVTTRCELCVLQRENALEVGW